ncbi:MAG: cytochrome c [Myxococcota bacterium]
MLAACGTDGAVGAPDNPYEHPIDRPLDPPIVGEGGPGEAPATALQGVLDCPTVDAPPYTFGVEVDLPLSEPFRTTCSSCHGPSGEGLSGYPAIPGALSFEEFRAAVRDGKGDAMPAFASASIDDASLRNDFEVLQGIAGSAPTPRALGGEWTWSESQVEEAYQAGLDIWRKPDHEGVACANCHSPDAFDLAIFGFHDDQILRRARLHLDPGDSAALVNLVHAQRRRFNIGRPCSPDYRPLQPGGEVLPGATPAEQDQSFGEQLVAMDYFVINGAVETVADARRVISELQATDLRRLPIGIELPRWTEDGFNGDPHNTINDYLAGVGRVPNDPGGWYAAEDAYIDDPSEANLLGLVRGLSEETHDLGYAERAEEANREANGRCNAIHGSGGFLGFTDLKKRESLMLVQHYLRMAALGRDGWHELGLAPHIGYGNNLNPFYRMGAQFAEFNCRNAGPMLASWPAEPAGEIPEQDLATGEAIELSRQINHPWQTLGMLYDPALMMREGMVPNQLHYWALHGFVQREVHLPFFYAHRVAQQVRFYEELRGTAEHPEGQGFFSTQPVHPLLDGERLFLRPAGFRRAGDGDTFTSQASNTLRCNIVRAVLLVQRELLQGGEPGNHIANVPQKGSLAEHYATWETVAEQLGRSNPDERLLGELRNRSNLCTTDMLSLIEEVRTLADGARDVDPG